MNRHMLLFSLFLLHSSDSFKILQIKLLRRGERLPLNVHLEALKGRFDISKSVGDELIE
jgi:hypothetical protein